ncbi:MAG: YggS family pyridoxal phosphate-dependent enzyme [Chromatiales bacterium]|nr:YggS family pyridoxal phosphate-dependent enzyme [Chromatiales bacterium]
MTDNSNTRTTSPEKRLQQVQSQIARALALSHRAADATQLLAVSKTRSAAEVLELYHLGQHRFGENYLQEALEKIEALADYPIEWHFIGPIQSNKTRDIATRFDWVHSVERVKIARRLSEQRPAQRAPLNICLQVNVSNEASKSGCSLDELPQLAAEVTALPNVKLRGLMAIPAPSGDPEQQRIPFRLLREALEQLNRSGLKLDTLSMGMTDDLGSAIAEGATIVRIGTALFGPRESMGQ